MNQKPARGNYTILKQICEYVPGHLVNSIAKTHDTGHAREVCAGIKAGEIVVFNFN